MVNELHHITNFSGKSWVRFLSEMNIRTKRVNAIFAKRKIEYTFENDIDNSWAELNRADSTQFQNH